MNKRQRKKMSNQARYYRFDVPCSVCAAHRIEGNSVVLFIKKYFPFWNEVLYVSLENGKYYAHWGVVCGWHLTPLPRRIKNVHRKQIKAMNEKKSAHAHAFDKNVYVCIKS